MKKKIFVDFYGVITNDVGLLESKEGALEFIKELYSNYEIWVFAKNDKVKVTNWLKENGFKKYVKEVTDKREPAYVYIKNGGLIIEEEYIKN